MKNFLRSLVPISVQVPVKYMINKWRSQLEAELQLLPFLVKRGETVIDIGGNRGQYTYALWQLGSKVQVFEPNPVCSRVLMAWASSKESVSVHQVGLSDQSGEAVLHIPVDEFGNEHDASASLGDGIDANTRDEIVLLSSLDSFTFDELTFVKIDVEGHEYSVLKGGSKFFHRQRPTILVEIEQRHNDRPMDEVFDLIESWGYCGFFLRGNSLMKLEKFETKRDQKIDDFDSNNENYINNFLFLCEERLAKGCYTELFSAWGAK